MYIKVFIVTTIFSIPALLILSFQNIKINDILTPFLLLTILTQFAVYLSNIFNKEINEILN